MGNIAIIGTTSDHGGAMISATGTAFAVEGSNVCRQGDMHTCPIMGHGVTPIVSGCAAHSNVQGQPIAIQGATAGCGAKLNGGFAGTGNLA